MRGGKGRGLVTCDVREVEDGRRMKRRSRSGRMNECGPNKINCDVTRWAIPGDRNYGRERESRGEREERREREEEGEEREGVR